MLTVIAIVRSSANILEGSSERLSLGRGYIVIGKVGDEQYIPALSYNWLTGFYDPVVRLTTRELEFKNALIGQTNVSPNHRVLDLACGTGTLTIMLKAASPDSEVIGVDGDPEVLGAAKGKAARAGFDVRFDEAMSYGLPYPDGSYDRVLSSLFFHHLTRENKSKTLDEVHRVLKPGGEVHVADWGSPATPLMGLSSRLIQFLDGFETTADSFAGLLPALMASAGFTSVQETGAFNTIWGTIRLHKAFKT